MVRNTPASTLSSKGQITLPLEIRRRLGLKEGDRVEFALDQQQVVLRPARSAGNAFDKYVGALPDFHDESEIHAWIAELREDR